MMDIFNLNIAKLISPLIGYGYDCFDYIFHGYSDKC